MRPEPAWRVLVTRPQPGASATARRLEAAGYTPLVLPLSETAPLPASLPAGAAFDAVAVTSAQALRSAEPALLDAARGKPLFAVGERTGATAREAGFASVHQAGGDVAALVRLLISLPVGRTVLYLCGRVRRPDFEMALAEAGLSVLPLETYNTRAAIPPAPAAAQALGGAPVQAVLLYSVLAARTYAELLEDKAARRLLEGAVPLALSQRILSALPVEQEGFAAGAPNEAALFALLAQMRAGPASFQPLRV